MQIGIVSPGDPRLARVYNLETGQELKHVRRFEYEIGADADMAEVRLTIINPDVHLMGELQSVKVEYDDSLLARLVRRWLVKYQSEMPADAQAALNQLLEGYRE